MEFGSHLIILCALGGLVAIDTAAGWQVMISQPIVACSIAGATLGDFQTGFFIGILFQLPWLAEIPAGGTHTSEGNVGSLAGAGIAIHLIGNQLNTPNIIIVFSLLWGILVGWLGGRFVNYMRRSNVFFVYRADRAAKEGNPGKITLLNAGGVGHAFLMGATLIALSFISGTIIIGRLAAFIPPFFDNAFSYGIIGMLAIGVGTMFSMFLKKKNFGYFIIGVLVAIIIFSFSK